MNMKVPWYLISLLLASVRCRGEVLHPTDKRTWEFPSSNGRVVAHLTSTPSTVDRRDVYSLQITCKGSCPDVVEEAGFLTTVTHDMETAGLAPGRVVAIRLDLREPDVSKRLSKAACDSQAWINAKPVDHGVIVADMLNAIGAYDAFNPVFAKYGLSVKVSHAEYVSTMDPRKTGLCSTAAPRVPSSATLDLTLRKMP